MCLILLGQLCKSCNKVQFPKQRQQNIVALCISQNLASCKYEIFGDELNDSPESRHRLDPVAHLPLGAVVAGEGDGLEFGAVDHALVVLGPNSIGNFWIEKSLEFWFEIPLTEKMLKSGYIRVQTCLRIKTESQSVFQAKLFSIISLPRRLQHFRKESHMLVPTSVLPRKWPSDETQKLAATKDPPDLSSSARAAMMARQSCAAWDVYHIQSLHG